MKLYVAFFVCVVGLVTSGFLPTADALAAPPSIGVVADDPAVAFADRMKTGRTVWDSASHFGDAQGPPLDANGWPTGDASNIVWEGVGKNDGTYAVIFNGIATLSASYGYATFSPQNADGTTGTYNSATNTTIATMVITDTQPENFSLVLTNTKRTAASATNTGVTNIQVLRPTSEGSSTSYPATTTFTNVYKTMEAPYTTFRFLGWDAANGTTQANWSDRVLPTFANQDNPVAWEYMIQLCNETNKDLYLNIPELATNDYITQLANLIAYGSNINGNVYTSNQANPFHAPLKSSLNIYLEYSNEVWNYFFPQFNQNLNAVKADIAAKNAEYTNLDFDGIDTSGPDPNGNYNNQYVLIYRRQAERIKDTSDIFRSLFGAAAMPPNPNPRVRPVLEWQYNDANSIADMELAYLNNYYNDDNGTVYFSTPHAPAYYLYGGGGATYFSSNNDDGVSTLLADGGFESPVVSNYKADPTGGSWTFSGTSGIAANGSTLSNPASVDGVQAGYVEGVNGVNGSFSERVTFPSSEVSNEYAVQVQSVQRTKSGATTADEQSFNVYVDSTLVGSFTPAAFSTGNAWPHFITSGFTASAGSVHTIKFVGSSVSGDNTAFIDSVAVTSTDSIFASGIPYTAYTPLVQNEADWSAAFGLKDIAYESGWALQSSESNGWETGSNVTIAAKYDSRATQPAINAENAFTAAGGVLNIYLQSYSSAYDDIWAFTDDPTILTTPLYDAILDISKETAVPVTNGTAVPATITAVTLPKQYDTDWVSYNLLVNAQATFYIGGQVGGNSSGQMKFYLDNVLLGSTNASSFGLTPQFAAKIAPGLHSVRVKGTGFSLNSLIVTTSPYPGAPANLAITPGDRAMLLTWTPPSGSITGYDLYRGSTAGGEGATPYVTGLKSASYTDTGLVNGTTYYYYVVAVNGGMEGNSSNEVSGLTGYFVNPGFETGSLSGWLGGGGNHGVDALAPHSGVYECDNQGYYNSIYETINGLLPNTTYEATAWGRLINAGPSTSASLYVSDYGGSQLNADFIGTTYTKYALTFTTGAGVTSAQIGQGMDGSETVGSYVDDFALAPVASTPRFSPAAGPYSSAQSVTISTASPSTTIYYTVDGSMPTTSSAVYKGPVNVAKSETINAITSSAVFAASSVGSAAYSISNATPPAAAPTFSVAGGTYTSAKTVILSDPTTGAAIHYTTDESPPTASSPLYSSPITVAASETINANATAPGFTQSSTATAAYVIVKTATLADTADSYITAGSYVNTNYGSVNHLIISRTSSNSKSAYNRCTYVKFDLTGISGTVTSAKLTITVNSSSNPAGKTETVSFYAVPNTSWTETGITWNNAPGLDLTNFSSQGSQIGTLSVPLAAGVVTLDLTTFVNASKGEVVTLQLMNNTADGLFLFFNSKEAMSGKPQLVVTSQ